VGRALVFAKERKEDDDEGIEPTKLLASPAALHGRGVERRAAPCRNRGAGFGARIGGRLGLRRRPPPAGRDFGQCSVPSGLSGVTAIAAGGAHSLALKGDGTAVAWGCGDGTDAGQCSVPSGLSGVTAIAAGGRHSLALKGDGTVLAWGCGGGIDFGQCSVPIGLSGVAAISAGVSHSLALKGDGTVVAWGCGGGPFPSGHDFGQCSVPSGLSGVTAIAAGEFDSLALKSDGTVVAWGCSGLDAGQCSVPSGLSGVTAIAAGAVHSLALKGDGTVVAWGCGGGIALGQCSVPSGLFGVTAIAAGTFHSLALVVPSGADLSITKSGAPNPVVSGNRLTYTLTVTNNGPQGATGVTVTDALPASLHFNSISSSQGTCMRSTATNPQPKGGTVTCSVGDLANGADASITIVVTATTPGTVTNTAKVSGNETDPDSSNNSSSATTIVVGT
jgi:uncharacterized repeat protein (TIGR01451 family)